MNEERRSNVRIDRRGLFAGAAGAAMAGFLGTHAHRKKSSAAGDIDVTESSLQIEIDAATVEKEFSRALLGEGLIFGFSYMWDEKNKRMWPGLMEKIKDLNTDFFGHLGGPGVWVHDYHWKNCIGPMERRRDPTPRFHDFDAINGLVGTHEYGLMLEQLQEETGRDVLGSIQVNIMTGTATEAADWVEYMNGSPGTKWGAARAENGHRDPFNVQYWELGNQPHFTFANVGRLTGVEYSKRVREFAWAMKQRDPKIKVTAYLPFFAFDGTFEQGMKLGSAIPDVPGEPGSKGPTWTQLVLKEAGDIIDALDFHWYGAWATQAQDYEYIMSSAYRGLIPNIERARETVQRDAPSDEARERLSRFVCPEYGAIAGNGRLEETATAVYGAVANSRLLHVFSARDDILYAARFGLFAPYPDPKLTREVRTAYAAIYGRMDGSDFMGTAVYRMKRLWAKAYQPKIVSTRVARAPRFSTGVSVLDATAMRSSGGDALNLVLTNAGKEGLCATIGLRAFRPAPTGTRLLVSGGLADDNRWETRETILVQESEIQTSQTFDVALPPHSVTAVLMSRA